jgi:hypothetical protein
MSVLPASFFRYFPEDFSVGGKTVGITQLLTHAALPNLLCSNRENRKNLGHYF